MATKKTKPPPDDPAQSARFVEAAREVNAEVTGKEFVRALANVIPRNKRVRRKPHPS